MHPHVPPPSLTQQVSALRERLDSEFGTGHDRAERALVAHAHSHLAELERLTGALGGPAPSLADTTLLGDAEWDLVHDEVAWSAEMFRIFARAPQDGPLTLDQLPGALHPEDRHAVARLLTEALVDGRPIDAEFRLQLDDGTVRPVHCVGAPQLAEDGGVHAVWLALRAR
ncbi:PAS domain-containing protein [Streptacidiphilus jiangxiensis]|uniref:PAS fold-containing protein n=1 Tax=Streptacidiphilus jiangxiensis TaxID=235985 RepID=A0A1H7UBH7_STRJI|nr:PAS domain-containing protein [Streptacidiphilus jiangxiensis]SEL94420.1 PAS fold-containing protein [Streptacidiphilus jiangxiensis]